MCRAEVDLAERSGTLTEFCNESAGYDVYLDHGPLATASVTVDGTNHALSAGSTLISSSDRAAVRTRSVVFDVPTSSRLIVRMVPR